MLTIIGILPATFALAPDSATQITHIAQNATIAAPLITQYDHDGLRDEAIASVTRLTQTSPDTVVASALRADIYEVVAGLKAVAANTGPPPMTGQPPGT
ncbi:hypothetical protein RAA17_11655 [Komagataeibacter rhaeticus]|nr:hypothetical protein [Komagataeibacter rhaeticus]